VVKNLIIVIGGNRVGNYETFAPIVNELKYSCKYDTLTIFQSKDLLEKISRNNILSTVYLKKYVGYVGSGGLALFHNSKLLFNLFFLVLKYQNVALLTNRSFNSFIPRKFIFLLKRLGVKTYYTKSFCRAPTNNLRSLLGGKSKISPTKDLYTYALIPTLEHRIEYGLLGYKLNQFIITGYPKFYPSWGNLLYEMSNDNKAFKSDVLFVFTKLYDNLDKVIKEVVNAAISVDEVSTIVLKPHPTTSLSVIQLIIDKIDMPSNKSVHLSEENTAFLSLNTKAVISFATSASYDSKVFGRYLINYYDVSKDAVDKYRNSKMSDMLHFELMESSVLSDFLADEICYEANHLQKSLIKYFSNKDFDSKDESEIKSEPSSLIEYFL